MKTLIAVMLFFAVAIGWAGLEVVEATMQPASSPHQLEKGQAGQVKKGASPVGLRALAMM